MGIVQIRFFCSENLVVKFPLWTEAASIYYPYGTGSRSIIDTWNMQPDPIQPPNTFICVPLAKGWGFFATNFNEMGWAPFASLFSSSQGV